MCKHVIINIQKGVKLNWNIVLADNAMLKIRPELFREWDFEKNDELGWNVWKMTKGMHKEVWWLGACGHEWEATVKSRVLSGNGCIVAVIKS